MKITEKQLMTVIGVLLGCLMAVVIYLAKETRTEVKENFKEISGLSARVAKLEP